MTNARWRSHINTVQAPPLLSGWLTDRMSLTQKLSAHSGQFRVKRLAQHAALCLLDEYALLGLARRVRVQQREVALLCDGVPVVYGHTAVPLTASAADWPFFSSLGERSLGTTLFGDPLVERGAFQFARLPSGHPLVQRAAKATGQRTLRWHARRCLFRRKKGLLLVTEVFAPAILELAN